MTATGLCAAASTSSLLQGLLPREPLRQKRLLQELLVRDLLERDLLVQDLLVQEHLRQAQPLRLPRLSNSLLSRFPVSNFLLSRAADLAILQPPPPRRAEHPPGDVFRRRLWRFRSASQQAFEETRLCCDFLARVCVLCLGALRTVVIFAQAFALLPDSSQFWSRQFWPIAQHSALSRRGLANSGYILVTPLIARKDCGAPWAMRSPVSSACCYCSAKLSCAAGAKLTSRE